MMPPPLCLVQVMLADREFMQTQLEAQNEHSEKLALALERMRRKLAAATGVEAGGRGRSGWGGGWPGGAGAGLRQNRA